MSPVEGSAFATSVIQVTNIAPQATRDQMYTLFSFVGRVEDVRLYPTLRDVIAVPTRSCFVKFADSSSVTITLHLNNTVFIDRAIIITPVLGGRVPEENEGLVMAMQSQHQQQQGSGMLGRGLSAAQNEARILAANPGLVSATADGEIATLDAALIEANLPAYPLLPGDTPVSIVEEIRRTVVIAGLDSTVSAQLCMECFAEKAGEVKYFRYCTREKDSIKYALIEFTERASVVSALALNNMRLGTSTIKVMHATQNITKPSPRASDLAQRNMEDAMNKVREAQNLVSATVDPLMGILGHPLGLSSTTSVTASASGGHHSRTRSRSRRRSRSRSRRRSRSRSRRRSRSRDRRRRSRSKSRRRSRSRDRHRRRRSRSRSRDRRRRRRSRSKSRDHRRRSRSRHRKRDKDRDRSDKEEKKGAKDKEEAENERHDDVGHDDDDDDEDFVEKENGDNNKKKVSSENGNGSGEIDGNGDGSVADVEIGNEKRKCRRSRSKSPKYKRRSRSRDRDRKRRSRSRSKERKKRRKSRSRSKDRRKRSRSKDRRREERHRRSKSKERKSSSSGGKRESIDRDTSSSKYSGSIKSDSTTRVTRDYDQEEAGFENSSGGGGTTINSKKNPTISEERRSESLETVEDMEISNSP